MSTVEASVFKNPSSPTDQIVLNTDGSIAGDLGTTLASKLDYPAGGADGDALLKSGTSAAWGSAGGVSLVSSEDFSAVSSFSVNGCFTATYDAYRMIVYTSAASEVRLRLRVSGSDATGSNYKRQRNLAAGSSNFPGSGTDAFFQLSSNVNATTGHIISVDIFRPFLAATTFLHGQSYSSQGPTATYFGNEHELGNSYDGFTLYPDSGNITGFIRVYGYRD